MIGQTPANVLSVLKFHVLEGCTYIFRVRGIPQTALWAIHGGEGEEWVNLGERRGTPFGEVPRGWEDKIRYEQPWGSEGVRKFMLSTDADPNKVGPVFVQVYGDFPLGRELVVENLLVSV